MRNYARFQVKIDVFGIISVIKDLICLVDNSSKSSMRNDMFDSMCLSFFLLILIVIKFYFLFQFNESLFLLGWIKINIDGAARGSLDLCYLWWYFP